MKKFYNWLKREEEREMWERGATPEDVEYFKCQEELTEQLLDQYTIVERVIGECQCWPPRCAGEADLPPSSRQEQ